MKNKKNKSPKKLKICIIGHGRAAKDTAAEFFCERGYKASSSSLAAAKIFLYDALKDKYGYKSFEECYDDRHNRRAEWYDAICEYNKDDKARLAKAIMAENDIYVGMRDRAEIEECLKQKIFDTIIWVDRPGFPKEDASSFNIDESLADCIIVNDGALDDLKRKVNVFLDAHEAWQRFEEEIVMVK